MGADADGWAVAMPTAVPVFAGDGVDAGAVTANLGADVAVVLVCAGYPDAPLGEQPSGFEMGVFTPAPR